MLFWVSKFVVVCYTKTEKQYSVQAFHYAVSLPGRLRDSDEMRFRHLFLQEAFPALTLLSPYASLVFAPTKRRCLLHDNTFDTIWLFLFSH